MVDSFRCITTATELAIDVLDGRCLVGSPLTICAAAAASNMVDIERLYDVMQSVAAAGPASIPSDQQGRSTIARFQVSDITLFKSALLLAAASLLPFLSVIVPLAVWVLESSG